MVFVEAHHPNGVWWNVTRIDTADQAARTQHWYRVQLEGLQGARVDLVERDGAQAQLLARETFTEHGWTEVR